VTARSALLCGLLALAGCRGEPPPRDMSRGEVAGVLDRLRVAPGLWELRAAVVDAAGPHLPVEARRGLIGPRPTLRHCITAAEAARPSARFLAAAARPGCAYRGFALAGDRLTGTTICPAVTTRMSGRYRPDGFDARLEIDQSMPDGAILTLTVASHGRRIGACPEQSPAPTAGAAREARPG
jgi:hypothetical protein